MNMKFVFELKIRNQQPDVAPGQSVVQQLCRQGE